jgi:hypothetical protein
MAGSKKGEHRGNARKRPKPKGYEGERVRRLRRTHESPGEIMYEALGRRGQAMRDPVVIDRRITVARIINGPSGDVHDITPKQMLLMGMHYHAAAIRDIMAMLDEISHQPVTPLTIAKTNALEAEIERLYDKSRDYARDVAGYVHAKLTAIATTELSGQNQANILQTLIDEIDEIERSRSIPIEYKPQKLGGRE